MFISRIAYPVLFIAMLLQAIWVEAAAIYPINKASILVGSTFDIKIELDQEYKLEDVDIQLNNAPIKAEIKSQPVFIANESGKGSSLIYRDIQLTKPGQYTLIAKAGQENIQVNWDVYSSGPRKVKNVILFIGDGMTIANRTSARVLSKGINEGKYQGKLSFDDMPNMALIGTSGSDSLITDSANSMSAYTTGHKTAVNAMGAYASRAADNLSHPKVETISELIKRKTKMSVGIVSDAELQDATPGAMVAHTRRRADKVYIADQLFASGAEVILGGGSAYFYPQSTEGSKRKDDKNLVAQFEGSGYSIVLNKQELLAAANARESRKLFGVFHPDNMDGSLDRFFLKKNTVAQYPDQPDLTEMTQAAINVLSKNPNGFFLMVEAALIDKFNHPLDWERAAFDTIMLSNAVQIAKDFAKKNPDTLIIVTPDHTHSGSISGVVNDAKPGPLREKVGVYAAAGYPNYPKANVAGYPSQIDVSKRLAFFYGNYPDHYETLHPKLDSTFKPAVKDESGKYVANPKYMQLQEDAIHMPGNLPSHQGMGVHTADDAVLNAMGPGSEKFRGFMDNTEVFKVMVETLGLGHIKP
ncbi:MAG: alkaline phosphatase [Polynucleobacter sp. 24-46-87]|jgi:alkaline phosphatase|uniref:alkaline phosphatase n=1 Tax=unclassified Polynucleobacter TaxID=2640945 RepID=UPI000BCDD727|nr:MULTISPECIES: alkaline phosphatase [unclassified Polynucleobacter]OYY21498.1 MAG: alkaline phosphatase [Polynucleobacter sp. 35-46-11]OZA12910.1 MAG: alkaline phosphatase [Polynucleobacter sp. 24-46-87]OZA78017.1 MAG: alkaline phosphatase [Polynucleobacter sp. 39-46-10]